ncbi:MAG: hypothetical protein NUV67_01225 [archaeon]|nr:hypothetical protein [archaeon]
MPIKPLPLTLVLRLRRLAKAVPSQKVYRALGKMKNIDHRREKAWAQMPDGRTATVPKGSTMHWGRRVREMNVSRNYPGVELVVKRTHEHPAKRTIEYLADLFRKVGSANPKAFVLRFPHVYEVSNDLIAMHKTDSPSLMEILGGFGSSTRRGKSFFSKLKREQRASKKDLRLAAKEFSSFFDKGISDPWDVYRNTLLLGYENGKFVFMQLPDVYWK